MQTLSTDPMTTNTAAYICAGVKVMALTASGVLVWALPESRVCRMSLEPFEYFKTWTFYIYSPYRAHTFDVVAPLPQPQEQNHQEEGETANQNSEHEISIVSLNSNDTFGNMCPAHPLSLFKTCFHL